MEKLLIVVDMQKDFISGSLGTDEAVRIVPLVRKKIENFDGMVIFTLDTHYANYLETEEGRNLPVKHCIKGTEGWELDDSIKAFKDMAFEKSSFGSVELALYIKQRENEIESVELAGLCTDICVISNAILIKSFCPEMKVIVDQSCTAGVTPELKDAALKAMASCQIRIV